MSLDLRLCIEYVLADSGVFINILPSFSFCLTSFKVWAAPRKSDLLCIKVTSFDFDSSNAQSNAESPPPNIDIFYFEIF